MAQTILGRIGQLIQANVNALLDQAEDPERMLDQLMRDYDKNIGEAEEAVAQTVGELRLAEEDQKEAQDAAREWGEKAAAASRKADDLRKGASTAEADRFDDLAKVALRRQVGYEGQAKNLDSQIAQQRELTDKLKTGLNKLRAKRDELAQKRDELVARAKMTRAQTRVQQAVKSTSIMDPTSELRRFEERIRREEAVVKGREEVSRASIEEQFEALGEDEHEAEVNARLAELKRR